MKTEHTPTPWRSECGLTAGSPVELYRSEMIGADEVHQLIARVYDGCTYESPAARDANAAYIVRAVNLHELLVEACRSALSESVGQPSRRLSESTRADLRHVLALAEGEGK